MEALKVAMIATVTATVLTVASTASAAVVTFSGGTLSNDVYTEKGVAFTPIKPGDLPSGNCPTDDPDCLKLQLTSNASPGTKAKAKMSASASGQLISLLAMDVQFDGHGGSPILSIYRNDQTSSPLEICLAGDSTSSCDYFTDQAFASPSTSTGPDDFHLDFTKLLEFGTFFTGATAFYFDNDSPKGTLRLDNILVAVPVPAAGLLLLGGLAAIGSLRRRKAA